MNNGILVFTYRWAVIVLGPLLIFGIFLSMEHVNVIQTFLDMYTSTFGDLYGLSQVLVKTAPFILTALAASLPSKTGFMNVGGEGQLAMGALMSTWVGDYYLLHMPVWIGFPLFLLSGAAGGAIWSIIAVILKMKGRMNETITTLLMNYIAFFLLGFFVHGALKDPKSFNWPFSPPIPDSLRMPVIPGTRIDIGIFIAAAIAVLLWLITEKTRIGFKLKVVGGNSIAAYQAGIPVNRMQFFVMMAAGAMAGIGGAILVGGIEGRLRPTTGQNYGYLGFLAAWMSWNHPIGLIITSFVIAAISVAGDNLQISSGLPSSSVNILMSVVLLTILALGRRKQRA